MTPFIPQAWATEPTVEAALDERDAIRGALHAYFRGWFEADPRRMRTVLHPRLAKFAVDADTARSAGVVVLGYDEMVEATANGNGVDRAGTGRVDISILGVSGPIASAEARCDAYVEFVLLVREGPDWRIVSSAWRWADGAGPRASG